MISDALVELSHWQFALSNLFKLFLDSLTLGLTLLLTICETAYFLTGKEFYKQNTKFWGRIFAVIFALSIAFKLKFVFQFGMLNSYFSQYAGEIFALPFCFDVFSSFFIGLIIYSYYLFGWQRLNKIQHLVLIWSLFLAVNISFFWQIMAENWLQHPLGALFNDLSLRLEISSFSQILTDNSVFSNFISTLTKAYTLTALLILAVSANFLIKSPKNILGHNGYTLTAILGLIASLGLCFTLNIDNQAESIESYKLAAIKGENIEQFLPSIEVKIRNGITAYQDLQELRDQKKDLKLVAEFNTLKSDLGYAFLLGNWTKHIEAATDKQINLAAKASLPSHPELIFWLYRIMKMLSFCTLIFFVLVLFFTTKQKHLPHWLLQISLYFVPVFLLAWISDQLINALSYHAWLIAENLPQFMGISSLSPIELSFDSIFLILLDFALLSLGWIQLKRIILQPKLELSHDL